MILKKAMITYISNKFNVTKEKILNILKEYGIFEVELIENFDLNILDYNNNFDNKKDIWSIIFYLPNNKYFEKKLSMINESLLNIEDIIYEIYVNDIDTNSYKDEWKKSFYTTRITDKIVVNPTWLEYEKKENEIVINIDPSMAFGTGAHETTALCIELLEKYSDKSNNILDVGCGSGILMLVAKKLGIEKVVGIDIDKNCKSVVEENFTKNDLKNYTLKIGNLVDEIDEKYDMLVSNILVDVLEKLLKDIEKVLNNGAIVIFSGILNEKQEKFIEKANNMGLKLLEKQEKNIWTGLVFRYGKD